MGYQNISAKCECGYKAENIEFGCTMIMLEVKKIDYMPAYCSTCGELIGVNILAKPTTCSKCHSIDIKIYGEPETTGKTIELDVSSDDFYKGFEENNEYLKKWAEKEGKKFVPENFEDYKIGAIFCHKEKQDNYGTPIFKCFNLCPKCKEFKLLFIEDWSGLHAD